MFALIDTFASDVREYIAGSIGAGDCGHIAPTLAVVRYDMQADSAILRAIDRRLLAMAREAAAEGYCAPQDRKIRVGVRVAGCGAIEATIRHGGEHVVVVVGLSATGFPNGPEALRLAALEAVALMDAEESGRAARNYRAARAIRPETRNAYRHVAARYDARRFDSLAHADKVRAERHQLENQPAPCECCGVRPQAIPAGDCGGGVVMWCEACHRDGGAE